MKGIWKYWNFGEGNFFCSSFELNVVCSTNQSGAQGGVGVVVSLDDPPLNLVRATPIIRLNSSSSFMNIRSDDSTEISQSLISNVWK